MNLRLAFRMNKLKTKYNDLAQCKLENSMLFTALLAIYKSLPRITSMSRIYLIIQLLLLSALLSCTKKSIDLNYVDFGDFKLKLPENYRQESLASPDSYAARIQLDWGELMFDYGLYSPKMTLSPEEYINSREWEYMDEFLINAVINPRPKFISVKKIDSMYYAEYDVSACLLKPECEVSTVREYFTTNYNLIDSTLIFKFKIPKKIYDFEYYISENDSIFKRLFVPFELNKYKSGVYILNKKSCQDELNCWEQLSIWTSDSIKIEREQLIKLLKSAQLK